MSLAALEQLDARPVPSPLSGGCAGRIFYCYSNATAIAVSATLAELRDAARADRRQKRMNR